ncbi:MAG: biopolymer transporter ExbD [Phycisphaerae bacterium]|jgi:biopolymer transport protein ExbD|nr:biopolymer transporter ExbD [Phycisphaerae bacterium]
MRIANNEDIEAPPNLMPLIDMVFLLLIFFLVASSLNQEEYERPVQLPRTAKTDKPMSAAPQQLIINILHDGSMKVSGRTVKQKELEKILVNIAKNERERRILIRADERSKFKYFAGVLDMSRACNINPVKVGYLAFDPKATVIPD